MVEVERKAVHSSLPRAQRFALQLMIIVSATISIMVQSLGLINETVNAGLYVRIVALLVAIFISAVVAHELGHVAGALLAGMSIESFQVFQATIRRDGERYRFQWQKCPRGLFGLVQFGQRGVPAPPWRLAIGIAGGPIGSIATGLICFVVASLVNPFRPDELPSHLANSWRSIAIFFPRSLMTSAFNVAGICNIGYGLFNLVPSLTGQHRTDGQYLLDLRRAHQNLATIGFPNEAVQFILMAIGEAVAVRRVLRPNETHHVSAREFCEFLLKFRGPETLELLRRVGITSSEEVGRVVFALIDAGCAGRRESDAPSDFDGLFDLSRSDGMTGDGN